MKAEYPTDIAVAAAEVVSNGTDLESLARPFLELLHNITGLDSTYLTQIYLDANRQDVRFSLNQGDITVPEGIQVNWSETLCKRSIETGRRYTDDVPTTFPDSQPAKDLGLQTYISVPVITNDEGLVGTLCGASGHQVDVPPEILKIMEMFARLIAQQWESDKQQAQLHERAEAAEGRLRQRATLLAEAEHKLKSPLTVIKGWVSILTDSWSDLSDKERIEAIEIIARSSSQLSNQVTDMLKEARAEVLTRDLHLTNVDLGNVARRVANELSASSIKHSIACRVEGQPKALADDTALWQVLVHLVENAIKYSPNGGTIEIYTFNQGQNAILQVKDEGLGIPDDVDIFLPFSRSAEQRFTKIEGTGIGLHIVSTLTTAMNGTVTAKQNENKNAGSTFTVSLPAI